MRVSLLVTCLVDLFEPDVGVAAVRVLRACGADVDVPSGQTCCGQPAWNAGFAEEAAKVARTTLLALEQAGPDTTVVVPAGSCATMVRVFWPELFELVDDHDAATRARRLAGRVREFSEFVAEHADRLPATRVPDPTRVAYHHSCHMLRELRIEAQPRALCDRVAGVEPVTWDADQRCCGFGGLFSMKLPEASVAMADDKLRSIAAAGGADLVVGCDSSCLMHLRARAEHEGDGTRAVHLAQLLAGALEGRRP